MGNIGEELENQENGPVGNAPCEAEPLRTKRIRKILTKFKDYYTYCAIETTKRNKIDRSLLCTEPNNYEEVVLKLRWVEVLNEELNSLQRNQIWELVTPPCEKKIVGCRWTY